MDVSLIIRLIDQASAPAATIADRLRKIGDVGREFGNAFAGSIRQGFSVENIEQATKNAEAALQKARGRLLGAFGMAMTLAAPIIQAGRVDQSVRGLDKVLDVTHSRLMQLRKFALDTSAMVPIAANSLLDLMSEAAQGGVPQEELEAFSLYVAKAAVAFDMAGAEIGERFAKLRNVYRLNQTGIEELGDATNHLSNNMAAKASEITDFANRASGAAGTLHLTAVQMSAVGAAMIAAGIAPETAARGLSALSNRVVAGGKQVEKAFKSIGMSRKAFQKALAEDGPAALEDLFKTMAESPKGMEALIALVGQDFSDDFAKFLGNPELLAKAFELVTNGADYAGSAAEEAAKQAEGSEKKWELFRNKLERLSTIIGDRLLPAFNAMVDKVGAVVDQVAAFADANPELMSTIVQVTAAIMASLIAWRLLAFAVAAIRLPMIQVASMFLKFDNTGRNIAVGWRVLSIVGRVLAASFGLVVSAAAGIASALAAVTAPVWAVVAAIVAAGFAIWKYWDRISSFASGFGSTIASALGGLIDTVGRHADKVASAIARMLGLSDENVAAFKAAIANAFDFSGLIEGARSALSAFWTWLGSFFSQEQLSDAEQAAMFSAGQRLAQSLIDGIAEFIASWITPIQDLFKFALEIEWPEPPAWLKWLMEKGGQAAGAIGDGADKVGQWWNDTGEQKTSGFVGDITGNSPPPAAGDGGSLWSNVKSALGLAGDEVATGGKEGGRAVAEGGREAAKALTAAAGDIRAAASSIQQAAQGARRSGGGVATAISNSKTGALHGGTE